jgi:hypothetical protein
MEWEEWLLCLKQIDSVLCSSIELWFNLWLLGDHVLLRRPERNGCLLFTTHIHRLLTIQSYSVSHGMERVAALLLANRLGALLVNQNMVRVVAAG